MSKAVKLMTIVILCMGLTSTFTGCKKDKKEGCTDINANNYDSEAEESNQSCTFPTINVSSTNTAGDISGLGGTASGTSSFTSDNSVIDWDMTINDATSGSFRLLVQDADGTTVIDNTLIASSGNGNQDAAGTSSSGTPGIWSVSISLVSFNGTGDYSLQ
jgi:hypothetical protein